ncbi:hypothetical protein VOLCADRAFT_77270 [Volvox carteri f. nagariensis]|uniref:Purple acid phosphatase n=1 Tax=Volvox carteri f. nagariensis TaxID=3068 RepID=D8UDV5_VOLCA|nr:uncharacterized protein VOLCADRAFT_77270 [Volvox carteri f. nagariensis]EFJ42112.1 hypothetical protein VOLCADRAFT_77270 [Volvox carteri f. nagariensis]|eukprot:XP_002956809.1 hypothetical protein VOLCADRAFT_77270 [Volvox carteri f. nagariensis]
MAMLPEVIAILALLACQAQSHLLQTESVRRNLIVEVGDAANQYSTAKPCSGNETSFMGCFLASSNAKDYPWGSPEIRYPADGSPWGVHLTGPYPDGTTYLVSWLTGAPTIGRNPAQPNTSSLITHAAVTPAQGGTETRFAGSIITYLRLYSDTTLANYSYLSPYIHHVILANLAPSTTYNYKVSCRNGSLAGNYSFKTLPKKTAGDGSSPYPLRIGIIGDVGQTRNSTATRDQVVSNNPQVVIHVGDNSYADNYHASNPDLNKAGGTNQQRWDSFNVLWEPLFSKVPVLNIPGNHEIESTGIKSTISLTTTSWSFPSNYPFQAYAARFPVPGSTPASFGNITANMFHSTVLGGVATLISINNYIAFQPGSPQYKWALSEFKKVNRTQTPWLFVQFHTSAYHTYTNHYKSMECFLSIWEPIFYQYGVDLVFNGHVHAYERTHPVYKYQKNTCGPIYVTVGDGGNLEGLYRDFVDDISSSAGKPRCELFTASGLSPAALYYQNPGGWSSSGPRPSNCPTMSFQPATGLEGGPPLMLLNTTAGQPLLGFCQSSQPLWSAWRDPSFGHAILDLISDTTARFRWYKNLVGLKVAVDDVVLERKDACVNRRRRQSRRARRILA